MDALAPASEISAHAAPERSQPVGLAERIPTIDLVRGMALLGILLMNIPFFGQAHQLETEPYFRPGSTDYRVFAVVTILFEGKMRALFSMLFGAGLLMFTGRKETAGQLNTADLFYRRLLWMALFGVIHEYVLLWVGDILFDYAICGLFVYVFRNLRPRQLLLAALVCLTITGLKHIRHHLEVKEKRAKYLTAVSLETQRKKLTEEQKKDKEAWEKAVKAVKPDPKEVAEMNQKMRSDYGTIYKTLEPFNIKFHSTHLYLNLWDPLVMMFLGMALYKRGFFQNRLSTRTYGLVLAGGYGIGLPLAILHFFLGQQAVTAPARFADSQVFPEDIFYDLQRIGLALGHASLLLLVYRAGVLRWLRGIANVGQMAFSNYILQSILCGLFFYGFGLGYFGKLPYHRLYLVVAGVWVVNLIFSALWLRFFRFGPLEWAWRSLTYWERQPWRRD